MVHASNDVYDFDTGADKNKKESVVNLVGRYFFSHLPFIAYVSFSSGDFCKVITELYLSLVLNLGSRTGTFIAAYLCLAFGLMGLTWTAVKAGNIRSILFLACAIICGYIYQVKVCVTCRQSLIGSYS